MIEWNFQPGTHRSACPACSRKANDKTLGVTVDENGTGVAHCFRCNYVETHHPQHGGKQQVNKPVVQPAAACKPKTLADYWFNLWNACKPVYGVTKDYLQSRRCALPPENSDLRCHPALKHPSGYVGPALVALITDVHSSKNISMHRTWVNADGSKANVNPPRMLIGGHRKQGGVIRLWPADPLNPQLAITEGIETALSLAHAFKPVWACIDAGNLAALPVLAGVNTLLIAADNDAAGLKAANTCASRWADAERKVLVTQQAENDLNDALKGAL